METYIVTLMVKPGHEDDVAKFYQAMEPEMKEAPGYRGRKIYKANTGRMAEEVHKLYSAEELAKHAEPPHGDDGTRFIMVEQWDSVRERMEFSESVAGGRQKDLIPHLLPDHSHEFYHDISVD